MCDFVELAILLSNGLRKKSENTMKSIFAMFLVLTLSACSSRIEGTEAGDCTDGADNDRDGLFDCKDDSCAGSPDCEQPEVVEKSPSPKYSTKNVRKGLSFSCDEATVHKMSKRERAIAKNEPFARHGRWFKTPWLRCHFFEQNWYEPLEMPGSDAVYSNKLLSKADWKCHKLVKRIEKEYGKYKYKKHEKKTCDIEAPL